MRSCNSDAPRPPRLLPALLPTLLPAPALLEGGLLQPLALLEWEPTLIQEQAVQAMAVLE